MEDFIRRRRLKSVRLGLAAGLGLGLYMTIFGFVHLLVPTFGAKVVEIWQEIYPFYTPTFFGTFMLLPWGFLDGFFLLWLIGIFYNWFTQSGYGCRNFPRKTKKKRGLVESEDA